MKNRVVAIFLSTLMILSSTPAMAYAETVSDESLQTVITEESDVEESAEEIEVSEASETEAEPDEQADVQAEPEVAEDTIQEEAGETFLEDDDESEEENTQEDGWVYEDDQTYYYRDGEPVTGIQDIEGKTYYFNYSGQLVTYAGYNLFENVLCVWDDNGVVTDQIVVSGNQSYQVGDDLYYIYDVYGSLEFFYGYQEIDGTTYYFEKGKAVRDGLVSNYSDELERWVYQYFDSDGQLVKNDWVTDENGYRRYFGDDGYAVTGVQQIGDERYIFDEYSQLENYSGNKVSDGYYVEWDDDSLVTVYQEVTKNDWFETDRGDIYYINSDGEAVSGIQDIEGTTYYFNYSGRLVTYANYDLIGSVLCFWDNNGIVTDQIAVAGNQSYQIGDDLYYIYEYESGDLDLYYGYQEIDGTTYYFENGKAVRDGLVSNYSDELGRYIYQYFDSDGQLVKNDWATDEDGYRRYFGEDGYAVTGIKSIDGTTYIFYEDGRLPDYADDAIIDGVYVEWNDEGEVTTQEEFGRNDWFEPESGRKYYIDDNGEPVTGLYEINGTKYYFWGNGQLAQYHEYVLQSETLYILDGTGVVTHEESVEGNHAYEIGDDLYYISQYEYGDLYLDDGYQEIDGTTYYLDNGKVARNYLYSDWNSELGRTTYQYFGSDGQLVKNDWAKGDTGSWKYFGEDGYAVTGLKLIDGITYVFNRDGNLEEYTGDGFVDGIYVEWNDKGEVTSQKELEKNAWFESRSGDKYYIDAKGEMATGLLEIDGTTYYFQVHGVLARFDREKNWQLLGKIFFVFNSEGIVTHQIEVEPNGLYTIDGDQYYITGEDGYSYLDSGFETIEGVKYYLDHGKIVKDQLVNYWDKQFRNYVYRYFDQDGQALTNTWKELYGYQYYFNEEGIAATGPQTIGQDIYMFRNNGRLYQNSYSGIIDGRYYAWDDSGKVTADRTLTFGELIEIDGDTFYILEDGTSADGIYTIEGDKYGFQDGRMYKNTSFDDYDETDEKYYRYYADEDGKILTSAWVQNDRIYVGEDGRAVDGLQVIDGKEYCFENCYLQYIDDPILIDGYFVLTNEDGTVKYKEQAEPGRIYTFDGVEYLVSADLTLPNGVVELSGRTYYVQNGIIQKNSLFYYWTEDDEIVRLYLDENGTPKTNIWYVDDDNEIKYYFGENGEALKGFCTVEGSNYYFDDSWGYAYLNRVFAVGKELIQTDGEGKVISREAIQPNSWIQDSYGIQYYNDDVNVVTGLQTIKGEDGKDEMYYFSDTYLVAYEGTTVEEDTVYCWDQSGKVTHAEKITPNQWMQVGSYKYWFDENRMDLNGIKEIDGEYYAVHDNHIIQESGRLVDKGKFYIWGTDGKVTVLDIPEDRKVTYQGQTYYVSENGSLEEGIVDLDDKKYLLYNGVIYEESLVYFDWDTANKQYVFYHVKDGVVVDTVTPTEDGFYTIDGKQYYFSEKDDFAGIRTINGKEYFFVRPELDWNLEVARSLPTEAGVGRYGEYICAYNENGEITSKKAIDVNRSQWVTLGDKTMYFYRGTSKYSEFVYSVSSADGYVSTIQSAYLAPAGLNEIDGTQYWFVEDAELGEARLATEAGSAKTEAGVVTWNDQGEVISIQEDQGENPQHTHSWDEGEVTKEATCTEAGERTYHCEDDDCDETFVTEIPATGHTEVVDKAVAATCTESGLTEGRHCGVCGEVLAAQETVPATGHTEVIDEAVAATCTETGLTEGSHCSVCGEILKVQEETDKLEHQYVSTVVKANATKKTHGSVTKECELCSASEKVKTIYYPKTVTLSYTSKTYSGKTLKPTVTVKDAKGKVISASYYSVKYTNSKYVGTATVTVTFKGNYTGSLKKTFKITPTKTSVSAVTAGSKSMTVKWAKKTSQVSGYQIQYSTNKNFSSGVKTVTVTKNSTTSKKITKLTKGKYYYVRIRTYKTVSGTKYYSGWSTAKRSNSKIK